MWEEIKNILTPKGELTGSPFFINYVILRLLGLIITFLGLSITYTNLMINNQTLKHILTPIFALISIFVFILLIFNYKRRLLNITKNLPISIILAIILLIGVEICLLSQINTPLFASLSMLIIPIILAIAPPKDADKKEYWSEFLQNTKLFFTSIKTIIFILLIITVVCVFIYKHNHSTNITPQPEQTQQQIK